MPIWRRLLAMNQPQVGLSLRSHTPTRTYSLIFLTHPPCDRGCQRLRAREDDPPTQSDGCVEAASSSLDCPSSASLLASQTDNWGLSAAFSGADHQAFLLWEEYGVIRVSLPPTLPPPPSHPPGPGPTPSCLSSLMVLLMRESQCSDPGHSQMSLQT